jgi:phage/plasmid primase-like uncharacterized protein
MMRDTIEQFRDAIRAAGMMPPDFIEPGRFHRFPGAGKRNGNTAGWCKLFPDEMGGIYGDYSRDLAESWQAHREHPLSDVEHEDFRQHVERAKAEAAAKRREDQADAAKRAAELWDKATPATAHPYLTAKGVQPHGARVDGATLLVPMRANGEVVNVQRIAPDGSKRFLSGGRVTGCYHSIGKPDGIICIVEGYATGTSVYEATNHAVAVAFNAGNLAAVAAALRERYPEARLILAADDDYATDGNPGLTTASAAARAVGGLVAVPYFGADRPDGATDFNDLHRHRGVEAVVRAIAAARTPAVGAEQPEAGISAAGDPGGGAWPDALAPEALHGIAGEFVKMTEPRTEADPAALLVQFLIAFGALVGRGPHFYIDGSEHHANLFALLVGATSKGRKGTSWARVREVYERIDDWKPIVSGLSSGEGIKYHVRDAREETKPNRKGEIVTELVDEGVIDKRLLVIESEFAAALRAAQRQGNTLSATIREAWDTGNLRTLTKHDPVTATGAHICIVGHITADELRAELAQTDTANGFANRFVFVAVRRSKLLPRGGGAPDDTALSTFAGELSALAATARTRGRLDMAPDAWIVWDRVYPELSAGGDGLHGAVTARAEAQVLRLALVYCLLDGADRIEPAHLFAALTVWTYCDATAKHIFGASLGDRIADEIMRRLRVAGDAGLTRNDIRDAFGRNQSSERIGSALEMLQRRGRATCETVGTGGRPAEVWRAAK